MVSAVVDLQQPELASLCRKAGVRRLAAFGSSLRADFDPERSDLDFLVEFADLPPPAYAAAYFMLKEGLGSLFNRPVDLVTEASLVNPHFRQRVEAERRTVYAR